MHKNRRCINIRSVTEPFFNTGWDDSEKSPIEIPIFTSVEERANFRSWCRFPISSK